MSNRMNMAKIYRIFMSLAVLLLGFAVSAQAAPARWTYGDEDTTVLMLGTIHVLKPGVEWLDSGLRDDIGRAKALVLETAQTPENAATSQRFVVMNGLMQNDTLANRLGRDYPRTLAAFKSVGLPENQIRNMRPWLASVSLAFGKIQALGFDPRLGVEAVLQNIAKQKGVPVRGLESPTAGLSVFANLNPVAENRLLVETVDQMEDANGMIDGLTQSWMTGDIEATAARINETITTNPALYQGLIVGRNKAWLDGLTGLLDEPGLFIVAVGAGHLAGPNDLVDLLEARGIKVTRIH